MGKSNFHAHNHVSTYQLWYVLLLRACANKYRIFCSLHGMQWRIYGGGGGGFRGFKPPPPPLGLPSKNLMCIEKRHHNMSRPTLCSYSTLSQAQPQTIGFKPPPPPLGLPSEHVTLSWTAFYGLHCVSRGTGQHHLRGLNISKNFCCLPLTSV